MTVSGDRDRVEKPADDMDTGDKRDGPEEKSGSPRRRTPSPYAYEEPIGV